MFLLQSIFYVVMACMLMSSYSIELTIMIVPVAFLYAVVLIVGRAWIYNINYEVQGVFSKLTGYLAERLGNIKMIKANNTEIVELNKGEYINFERYSVALNQVKFDTFLQSFQGYMNVLLTGIVIIIGNKMVIEGKITLAALISFYFFIGQLPSTFQMFVQTLLEMYGTKGSTIYVSEIVDLPCEEVKRESNMILKGDISFEDVSFSYDDSKKVLDGFSAEFLYGKMTAIVGLSGSGKTTVLKLIERFYNPDLGRIKINGYDVDKINLDEWRREFGYVIQNSLLISGTVRDNILYGASKEYTDEDIYEILKVVNADEFVDNLENGLDTDIGDLGMKLSGGQRQRLAIARL